MSTINAYYIRCRPERVPELLALGVLLGVLVESEGVHAAADASIVWDPIGSVHEPTGELDAEGQPVPVCDADGVELWHANLFTPFALLARAQQMAQERPEIAGGLAAIPELFVTDPATGEAVPPRSPARVLLGVEPT